MTKVVGPICGFHWGFDRITGESRSLPIQPAECGRTGDRMAQQLPVDVSRVGVPAGKRRRSLGPPAATGGEHIGEGDAEALRVTAAR